jgi:CHASE2 domain-containing sensor protein
MNERTQVSVGLVLLIVGSVVVFLYALPMITPIPAILSVFAALGMSAGTLLVGTSKETV